ncbi:hypothetical protein CW745_02645 [Psychromonas sp. psych-6C06]|uniref:GGDEF domain-containing protein n=1 Tax=Psychromonas sp. psych-6C06 TaxID=2058089 RepID=UPI000C3225F9|nr:GGDEF domain-containing protein [Psychromonas sp. psych-6C06]PKF63757.1 hypothetical protein CW745_02645 [Psychromonas sp. psych-6C06]
MGFTQRLYLFSFAGFGLMVIILSILAGSWNSLNIAMEKVDYTQRVSGAVNDLQLNIFTDQANRTPQKAADWFAGQRHFTNIISSVPTLTPRQQTLQNAIINQHSSIIILFRQVEYLVTDANKAEISDHLYARLLTQIELIREDCAQLAENAEAELRYTVLKLFYILAVVLITTVVGLAWGALNISQVFKSSIKEIEYGINNLSHGEYKEITLSQRSTEFNEFVEQFNKMSKQLAETTISRDSLQALVDERTAALEALSNTDPLTNVANRRALYKRGETEFLRSKRYPSPLALLMIDCDFFKKINDTHGHLVGDHVLKQLCRTFEKEIRDVDFLARYGGEEFVILLPHCETQGAIELAKRLQQALNSTTIETDNISLTVTVSIGIALSDDDDKTFEGLLNRADESMFLAKENGRNRYEINSKVA